MGRAVGVLASDHVAVGLVENNQLVGSIHVFPQEEEDPQSLLASLPADDFSHAILEQIELAARDQKVEAVGVAIPGIVKDGIVQDSPNLQQLKGLHLQEQLSAALGSRPAPVRVGVFNDADVVAAGIAAKLGRLQHLIRVWTLGNGIGFGRYPWTEGVWEGGHTVVTLDPHEHYCGCGGRGHLEGIMGHRAMRLRFLDMEPEEVFASAKSGDPRCEAFVKQWHRALAAATANSIHMTGPGKFFITGPNSRYVDLDLLYLYLNDMVKMTPLQGSQMEVIATTDEIGIIGAAVNAQMAARIST